MEIKDNSMNLTGSACPNGICTGIIIDGKCINCSIECTNENYGLLLDQLLEKNRLETIENLTSNLSKRLH